MTVLCPDLNLQLLQISVILTVEYSDWTKCWSEHLLAVKGLNTRKHILLQKNQTAQTLLDSWCSLYLACKNPLFLGGWGTAKNHLAWSASPVPSSASNCHSSPELQQSKVYKCVHEPPSWLPFCFTISKQMTKLINAVLLPKVNVAMVWLLYKNKQRKTTEITRIHFPQDLGTHVNADIFL